MNVETQENIGFLRKPSEMQVNRKLFQGRRAKEMPSKARKQEIFAARKHEECQEQKSQQIQERDARKSKEELANANVKIQETSTRKYDDEWPGLARKHFQHDDAAGNLVKMCEMMRTPQRNDAGRSPDRMRCTDRSAGKVVRREDANFKFKHSTVANLINLFEPSLIRMGLTEGPSQLFSAKGQSVHPRTGLGKLCEPIGSQETATKWCGKF